MARGKKVFNIEFFHAGRKFTFPVRMVRADYGKVTFYAEDETYGMKLKNTDAEKLQQDVREHIEEWVEIAWELWCVVSVTGGEQGHHNCDQTAAEIDVEYYAIGTHKDGQQVHNETSRPDPIPDGPYTPTMFDHRPTHGLPDHASDESSFNDHERRHTRALIRATPENVAALDNFRAALRGLVDKMHDHFHPKKIGRLLTSPGLLLPAPKPKAKGKKMPKPKKKKVKV